MEGPGRDEPSESADPGAPTEDAAAIGGSVPPATRQLPETAVDGFRDGPDTEFEGSRTTDFEPDTLRWEDVAGGAIGSVGRYQIILRLGEGGFGAVYLALDPQLERTVAVKLAHPDRLRGPVDIERFLDEARMLAALDHPHILPVYDAGGGEDGPCYLVTKYIEGTNLAARMVEAPPSLAEAASLVARVAEGLAHAHAHGLIHRDIKPGNILIADDGHPYLADFGLAMRDAPDATYEVAGTPEYMSPEQLQLEGHRVDARSDIYSLGVVLYRLLTGRSPHQAGSTIELLRKVVREEIVPPIEVNPAIPAELDRICRKMLEKRAADRYQSAVDLVEELSSWDSAGPDRGGPGASIASPKGLGRFDAGDAGAFLALLPGPRDRDGLPPSIASWKRRIESIGAESFRVGLLMGPSGSGKSSLIAAGLVPRLSRRVAAVVVDAGVGGAEALGLASVRAAFPGLPDDLDLRGSLASLRRSSPREAGRKLLLILDQFEQCLASEADRAGLAEALRQCDGARVQALLVVRDDFALAASRFFEAIEEPMAQGRNFDVVDRFDVEHARAVLIGFGRALGRVEPAPAPPTAAQAAFVEGALAALAESGEVAPIRLSVFVEMVRDRPWEPRSLREVGGLEGLGVAFLEDLFNGPAADPRLRALAEPAREVLRALLPPPGSSIRGGARTAVELREAAGTAIDPRGLGELLALLGREARLVAAVGDGADTGAPRYALAHDFLVPSLRAWVTLKRRETARGRAELLLADRAAGWSLDRSRRQLPTAAEFLTILLRTRPASRTDRERAMLRAAVRHHGARASAMAAVLAVAMLAGLGAWGALERRRLDVQARGLVDRLVDADPVAVPAVLAEIGERRDRVAPFLDLRFRAAAPGDAGRRRTALGLLADRPDLAGVLVEEALRPELDLEELRLVAGALGPVADRVAAGLWDAAGGLGPEAAFRASLVLAAIDGRSDRWAARGATVASALIDHIAADPSRFEAYVDAFRPVRSALVGPLLARLRSDDGRRPLTTGILVEYARDDPEALASLLTEVDPDRITEVAGLLGSFGARGADALERRLDESIAPEPWAVPAGLAEPEPSACAEVAKASGRVEAGSAHAIRLPLSDFEAIAGRLGAAGYRPDRVRPYRDDAGTTSVAAVWVRDRRPWRLAIGLTPKDWDARGAAMARDGFVPVDLASYPTEGSGWLLASAWVRAEPGAAERRTTLDDSDATFRATVERLEADHYDQETHHILEVDGAARRIHAAVWSKVDASRPVRTYRFDGSAGDYGGELYPGASQRDVGIGVTDRPRDLRRRMEAKLAEAEAKLRDNPMDPNLRFDRGYAHFFLGHDDEALADWDALIAQFPAYAWMWKMPRMVLHTRRGDLDRARADLRDYAARSKDRGKLADLSAYLRAREGDPAGAADALERAAREHAGDPQFLYCASNGMSRIAGLAAEAHLPDAPRYVDRAVRLLEDAVKAGLKMTPAVRDDADFEPINRSPGFVALVGRGRLEDRYTALWHPSTGVESIELHGLTPAEHADRSRDLPSRGYRPVAVAAFRPSGGDRVLAASTWERRRVAPEARRRLSGRKAAAAVGLILLNRPATAWPLLDPDADPDLAGAILDRLIPAGIAPAALDARLAAERDPGARMTLILALGRWPADRLPGDVRRPIADRLIRLFETDPDPGVHSAAEWTLKRWEPVGWPSVARKVASRPPRAGRGWFTDRDGAGYVAIAPSTFLMGARPGEAEPSPWIREDLHRREVPRRFAFAMKEVTNAQFARFLEENPGFRASYRGPSNAGRNDYSPDPDGPATLVSFPTAAAYCRWLTAREGMPESEQCYDPIGPGDDGITFRQGYLARRGYRLPTEAEWELAARAVADGPDPVGGLASALGSHAWFADNAAYPGVATGQAHPTAMLLPNRRGAFDVLGNAMEWTSGRGELYPTPEPGKAALDREHLGPVRRGDYLVARGGSFALPAGSVRLSSRFRVDALKINADLGFRVARTLSDP